jgi:hypothetical protein
MGREATALCEWRGESAEAKILLESQEIILRGAIKARLAREALSDIFVEGEALHLKVAGEPLILSLGAVEAGKWYNALLKPMPTLAEKLGVSADTPVFVLGAVDDPVLVDALAGATVSASGDAAVLIACLHSHADLAQAIVPAALYPALHLWCIYPKGKDADVTDAMVRTAMRDAGLSDSKSCAVSERLTATRYRQKG